MSNSGAIREIKSLKFGGIDLQNKELFYQGALGTTKYIFDFAAINKHFGSAIKFGDVFEFVLDPTSPAGAISDLNAGLKITTFKDYLGRYFLPIGCLISPKDAMDPAAASDEPHEIVNGEVQQKGNLLPLYAIDANNPQIIINLVEAVNDVILRERYPLRVVPPQDHGLYDSRLEQFPFGFSTVTLYGKYFVKENEEVYLANLLDRATIIGEAFGCVWVRLGSSGKVVPLPKATDEARLVNLYGLSDVSAAPQPGQASYGQPAISPRQIQTPRGNQQQGGPPFTLNKKTADNKPAVLCNCPMNQTVLAVCTTDALAPFGVKPMGRIFFTLGVDAGKSATILGVRNGNLYIHIDGASKCVCLRNATNAEELRERYTGTDSSKAKAAGQPALSPAATMPRSIAGPNDAANTGGVSSSSSPLGVPKLSLGNLSLPGFGGNARNAAGESPTKSINNNNNNSPQPRVSPTRQQQIQHSISPVSNSAAAPSGEPPKGFYYWTANGCMKFDISAEGCKLFGLRHCQTVRFSSGPDAGQIYHVVGARNGCIYVVKDRHDIAVPLRHCANAEEVQARVSPVLLGTAKLRSADPRGPAPHVHSLRSPDRRAGSPFGLSPRNYKPEPEEDVGNWGKEPTEEEKQERMARRQTSQADLNNMLGAHHSASRDLSFSHQESTGMSRFASNNNLMSGTFEAQGVGASRVTITKSMSPSNISAARSINLVVPPAADHVENNNNNKQLPTEISVSIGRKKSSTTHPLDNENSNNQYLSPNGLERGVTTDRTSSIADSISTNQHDPIVRNTRIPPPRPVRHEAFKVGNMPATRLYLKAIALRALGVKRESDMPTAFFRFFSHDAGQNLSRALQEMPKFQAYWEQREKPMRGGRSFQEATCDMMVEALENLAQLRGE